MDLPRSRTSSSSRTRWSIHPSVTRESCSRSKRHHVSLFCFSSSRDPRHPLKTSRLVSSSFPRPWELDREVPRVRTEGKEEFRGCTLLPSISRAKDTDETRTSIERLGMISMGREGLPPPVARRRWIDEGASFAPIGMEPSGAIWTCTKLRFRNGKRMLHVSIVSRWNLFQKLDRKSISSASTSRATPLKSTSGREHGTKTSSRTIEVHAFESARGSYLLFLRRNVSFDLRILRSRDARRTLSLRFTGCIFQGGIPKGDQAKGPPPSSFSSSFLPFSFRFRLQR